jgi:hypothetical protein
VAAIRADETLRTAIADRSIGSVPISSLSPELQFFALAPQQKVCWSGYLAEDHPVRSFIGRPFFLALDHREALLDAVRIDADEEEVEEFLRFFSKYYGAPAFITGAEPKFPAAMLSETSVDTDDQSQPRPMRCGTPRLMMGAKIATGSEMLGGDE